MALDLMVRQMLKRNFEERVLHSEWMFLLSRVCLVQVSEAVESWITWTIAEGHTQH